MSRSQRVQLRNELAGRVERLLRAGILSVLLARYLRGALIRDAESLQTVADVRLLNLQLLLFELRRQLLRQLLNALLHDARIRILPSVHRVLLNLRNTLLQLLIELILQRLGLRSRQRAAVLQNRIAEIAEIR